MSGLPVADNEVPYTTRFHGTLAQRPEKVANRAMSADQATFHSLITRAHEPFSKKCCTFLKVTLRSVDTLLTKSDLLGDVMFGSSAKGANAYAQVSVETSVSSASPHKLVVLLFDGAIACLSKAMLYMNSGNVAEKGKSISHAIMIIDSGLRASLNKNAGGEIARMLDSLYEYMSHRLLMANLRNQPEILTEVLELLKDLRGSWAAISPDDAPKAPFVPAIMRAPVASDMYSNKPVTA